MPNRRDQRAFPDSVGRIIEGIEAEIVDENDNKLAPGEVGIVRFRGTGFPAGYVDNADASSRSLKNGWFYPGDVAVLNEQGYLFFQGRVDDMINNSGIKFYPVEVENVLLKHELVQEAAVFPYPHRRVGEIAAAFVVLKSRISKRELQDHCTKYINRAKIPVYIVGIDALPRNKMGKVLKKGMADLMREKLK